MLNCILYSFACHLDKNGSNLPWVDLQFQKRNSTQDQLILQVGSGSSCTAQEESALDRVLVELLEAICDKHCNQN
jgi:hypothetical protein